MQISPSQCCVSLTFDAVAAGLLAVAVQPAQGLLGLVGCPPSLAVWSVLSQIWWFSCGGCEKKCVSKCSFQLQQLLTVKEFLMRLQDTLL